MRNDSKLSKKRKECIHKFINSLNINTKYQDALASTDCNNLMIINEALTHTSFNNSINHERLEFLGDAVLRLAATNFIEKRFFKMTVGEKSSLRSHLVSDKWLTKVGKELNIEKVFLVGKKAEHDLSALSTLQAEATEALIGAIYECLDNLNPIIQLLNKFWEIESKKVLADPHKYNPKSALQEWTQSNNLKIPIYLVEEISKEHGNPKRFVCEVKVSKDIYARGWGGSHKDAEKEAAKNVLKKITQLKL
tara:strand:+ start:121 stop:870 length:750 start_codon:yes stop_codon:yes gene_type:complete